MLAQQIQPFTLRNYQKQAISDTYNLIRQGEKRILLFAATGAGKTLLASKITSDAVSRGKRVLFVVHRDILVGQTANKFSAFGLRCGFIKAGWTEDASAKVQIASVQTLACRESWKNQDFDVIFYDECHLVAFAAVCRQMMSDIYRQSLYIGLSATPWRLSKRESLGDIYTSLVCAPMPKTLIESGFLTKPSYYGLNFVNQDLDKIKISGGDYNVGQLSTVCNKPILIEQIVKTWLELGYGRPTIAFAVGVKHAKSIADEFNKFNIPAATVTGKTPIPIRNQLYDQLARGELMVLSSCAALSEGFDVPQVSCVILARPTQSKALYMQQLGRGIRLAPDKTDCLVLDQSSNVLRHGFIEDLESVELIPSSQKEKKPGKPPLKLCPSDKGGCGSYVYSFQMKCKHCGYNFEINKLIEILGSSRLISPDDEVKLTLYRSLLREAYQKNYAPSWAWVQFKKQHGFSPPFDWGRGAIFDGDLSQQKQYKRYLKQVALRMKKDKDWIEKYLRLEFGKV
ncbi:MAG: DEAD/DEAH box helicase [Xenococcaceae cyanobacterium MO_188.B19]|nr:DEAD/DEAH box helicase [Xenococcaceae cyanobacterium MO_188.B19]